MHIDRYYFTKYTDSVVNKYNIIIVEYKGKSMIH